MAVFEEISAFWGVNLASWVKNSVVYNINGMHRLYEEKKDTKDTSLKKLYEMYQKAIADELESLNIIKKSILTPKINNADNFLP